MIKSKNWYSEVSLSRTSKLDKNTSLLQKLLFKVAKKWVSGNTYKNALLTARDCNSKGVSAILNFLGEYNENSTAIGNTVTEYFSLLNLLESNRIDGCISVKPTQIGMTISYDKCLYNFRQIAGIAKSVNKFMWIDIENSNYVEDTLSIYLEILRTNRDTGVAIQSYLKRSYSDLLHLMENSANLRIVKGAYSGETDEAYQSNSEVSQNFSRLMRVVMKEATYEGILAVATHDSKLIDEALSLSSKGSEKMKNLQFQLLKGIRDELKQQLVKSGYTVLEYIPYGEKWLHYSLRRIRERKRNIFLLARSLI